MTNYKKHWKLKKQEEYTKYHKRCDVKSNLRHTQPKLTIQDYSPGHNIWKFINVLIKAWFSKGISVLDT